MPNKRNTRDLQNAPDPEEEEEDLAPPDPYHPHIVIHMMGKRYEMNPPKRGEVKTPKKKVN